VIEAADNEAKDAGGIAAFLGRLAERSRESGIPPAYWISAAIAEIDRRLHAQLDAVLRAPEFRRLEAAWSSLEYAVAQKPRDANVRIRVLNVTRVEILEDLEDAIEFDRSALFQLIYEHEFGQFGGAPYTLLVLDEEFAQGPEDVEILRGLAGVAAAAHTILLAGASPELFGLEAWGSLGSQDVPEEVHGGSGFSSWRALREMEDARYLGLVLPRVLLRAPYRPADPERTIRLREDSFDRDGSGLLWGNAAFVLGARAMEAFHLYGWCTAIRGLTGGAGVAEGLPELSFATDREGRVPIPPVEVVVTEAGEKALADLGLIPLCRVGGTHRLAFFGVPSLHLPKQVDDALVATNLKLSAQIPYMLAASRFAHYLKVMMRDRVGRFQSREEIQHDLAEWLARYTIADDDAPEERKATYPLRDYRVEVRERPGRPGQLEAITQLQPHYQIEDPGVTLRLAVELPDPEKTRR
jgi:type VI secretion system protein ImpC